jgi:hypothetical protein
LFSTCSQENQWLGHVVLAGQQAHHESTEMA